jgi:hypothetical protein
VSPSAGTPTGGTIDGHAVTVEMLATLVRRCLLCNAPEIARYVVFVPEPHTVAQLVARTTPSWGPVRPGKHRTVVYALCAACHAAPNTLARVENILLGEAAAP